MAKVAGGKRSTPVEQATGTETPDDEAFVDTDEVKDETAGAASEETTAVEETAESTESTETTEAEQTAAELKAQLEAKDAEIATLKAGKEPEKAEAIVEPGAATDAHIDNFNATIAPKLKAVLLDEKATLEQKYEATRGFVSHGIGAILADKVYPNIAGLAMANLRLQNELEIRDLRTDDARFKGMEALVRKELVTLGWNEREKPGAVQRIFHRIVGERSNGTPAAKPVTTAKPGPTPSKILRDVSAGSGATTVREQATGLTSDQKYDLDGLNENRDNPMAPQTYLSKLKARRDKIKAQNEGKPAEQQRKLPGHLRESV